MTVATTYATQTEAEPSRSARWLYWLLRAVGVVVFAFVYVSAFTDPTADAAEERMPRLVLLPPQAAEGMLNAEELRFLTSAFDRMLRQSRTLCVVDEKVVKSFLLRQGVDRPLASCSRKELARAGLALRIDGFVLPIVRAGGGPDFAALATHFFATELARVSWVREHVEPMQVRRDRGAARLKAYMRAFAKNVQALQPQLTTLLDRSETGRRLFEALPPSSIPFFHRALDESAFSPTPIATEGYDSGVEQLDLRTVDFRSLDRVLGEQPVKATLVRYERRQNGARGPYALRVIDLDEPCEAVRYIESMFPDMPYHPLTTAKPGDGTSLGKVRAARWERLDLSAVAMALGKFVVVAEGPPAAESDLVALLEQVVAANGRIGAYYERNPQHPRRRHHGRPEAMEPVEEQPTARAQIGAEEPPPILGGAGVSEEVIRRIVKHVIEEMGVPTGQVPVGEGPAVRRRPVVRQAATALPAATERPATVQRPSATVPPSATVVPATRTAVSERPVAPPAVIVRPAVVREAPRTGDGSSEGIDGTTSSAARLQASMGQRYLASERYDKAAGCFRLAVEKDPEYRFARVMFETLARDHGVGGALPATAAPAQRVEPMAVPTVMPTVAPPPTVEPPPTVAPPPTVEPPPTVAPPSTVEPTPTVEPTKPTRTAAGPTAFSSDVSAAFEDFTYDDDQHSASDQAKTTALAVSYLMDDGDVTNTWPFWAFLALVFVLLVLLLFNERRERTVSRKEYLEMLATATAAAKQIADAERGNGVVEAEAGAGLTDGGRRGRLPIIYDGERVPPPQPPPSPTVTPPTTPGSVAPASASPKAGEDDEVEIEIHAAPAAVTESEIRRLTPRSLVVPQTRRRVSPFVENTQVGTKTPLFDRLKQGRKSPSPSADDGEPEA